MFGKKKRNNFVRPDQAAFFSPISGRTSPTPTTAGRTTPEENPTTTADKDSSRENVDANIDNVDASATDGTISPNKEEHGDSHIRNVDRDSSKEDGDAHIRNVDSSKTSATEGKIPPIIQEHSATPTSNDKLPQDSSTSANTDGSSLDSKPHSSSMENPATTSSATPSQEGSSSKEELRSKLPQDSSRAVSPSANIDGSPLDNGLNVAVPSSSSSSADKDSSATEGKNPPIIQPHSATTPSNLMPSPQDLSTSANSIQFGSLRYDGIKGTLSSSSSSLIKASSRKDVHGSARDVTIPPTKQELSASMITSDNGGEPPQDGLTASPSSSSSSSSSASSRKDGPLPGKSRTNEPIKQDDPTTSSILEEGLSTSANTVNVETHMENVDASVALPPINQEHSATIRSATTSQEGSSRSAFPSTDIDRSPLDDPELNVAVSSSSADKDLSATNKTIPQIIQEHSLTTSNGTPPQDSSTSANIDSVDKDSSRVDADAHTDNGTNRAIPPIKEGHSATPTSIKDGFSASSSSASSRKADGPLKKGLNPDARPFEPPSKPPQGSSTASHAGVSGSLTEPPQDSRDIAQDLILLEAAYRNLPLPEDSQRPTSYTKESRAQFLRLLAVDWPLQKR